MAESADRQVAQPGSDGVSFLREMCARHARVDAAGQVVIDLPEHQINALGVFLVHGVVGFFLGLNHGQAVAGARAAVASSQGEAESRSLT